MENIFLKLEGEKGPSVAEHAKDQIEVLSVSVGVTLPIIRGSASGVSVKHGRPDLNDLTFSKYLDPTSPNLNLKCCGGNNIKKAEFGFFVEDAAAGKPVEILRIELEDILISSISISASGDSLPIETVCLHYNKINWIYTKQGRDAPGGNKGKVTGGYDLEKGKTL